MTAKAPLGQVARDLLCGEPEEWWSQAACVGTDSAAFFPDKGGSVREAKRVCARCPVTAECLDDALVHDDSVGVFGGLSERERHKLKRRAA